MNWFSQEPDWEYQTYATRDANSGWPHPDGAIEIAEIGAGRSHMMALEFKRVNEGLHGILTGVGQVQAYIHKGFGGAILVLPDRYVNLDRPGEYAASVLQQTAPNSPVGVFTYSYPDLNSTSPFQGRLDCVRSVQYSPEIQQQAPQRVAQAGRQRTQWAHVREGSTAPDPLYRYLLSTLHVDAPLSGAYTPQIISELHNAVVRIDQSADPVYYLSYTSATRGRRPIADEAWRRFWFENIVTPDVQRIWRQEHGNIIVDAAPTRLKQWNGDPVVFFARSGTGKAKIVDELRDGAITEDDAWEAFARNIRNRAHQFREDVDSGAEATGLIDVDGRLTDLGFHFVNACERSQDANSPQVVSLLRWALLVNGQYLALLHYIHSISERVFHKDSMRFTEVSVRSDGSPSYRFLGTEYRRFILDELSHSLRVAGRSAERGGRTRPPLEGEFITLRKLGLIGGFRSGLGLEINWPAVHAALERDMD